jgi:hypothetical protein
MYMVCLDSIFNNPLTAGLATGFIVFAYFFLLSISTYLPPAAILSFVVGALVYTSKGGKLFCEAETTCQQQFTNK